MFKSSKRLVAMLICLAMVLSMLPMSVFAAGTTIYVQPNENWLKDGARFAAYFFGAGDTWVDCVDAGDGLYSVEVPGDYPNVIFCRMNPDAAANNWDNKWNQTLDLTVPTDTKVVYVVADGTWDKGNGQWIEKGGEIVEIPTDENWYLRGTVYNWDNCDDTNRLTDNGDGTWSITMSLVAGSYSYKVAKADWSEAYGDPNSGDKDGNAILNLPKDADVTFTLKDGVVTATYENDCTHANVTELAGKDATCTEAGLTEGSVCADCGESLVAQEEIPALGHNFGDGDTCGVCGLVKGNITIYFENNWMFGNLTGYWWGSSFGTNPEWPGVSMELYTTTEAGYEVYALTVPSDVAGVLFTGTDNDNGSERKTPDITPVDGQVYYMNWTEELGEHVGSYDVSNLTPACEHEYEYDCSTNCKLCGEETRPEAKHEYFYACDPVCMLCYEVTNESAAHSIKPAPLPVTSSTGTASTATPAGTMLRLPACL